MLVREICVCVRVCLTLVVLRKCVWKVNQGEGFTSTTRLMLDYLTADRLID